MTDRSLDSMLTDVLSIDPLDTAEKITGKHYTDDDSTRLLGMSLFFSNNMAKKELLQMNNDSHYSMKIVDFMKLVDEFQFKCIMTEKYSAKYSHTKEDIHQIFWNYEYGILLNLTTYELVSVNSCNIFYCYKPTDKNLFWNNIHGGGHMEENDIWVGNLDVREAFRHKLDNLKKNGTFIVPWVGEQLLTISNSCDYEDENKTSEFDYSYADEQRKRRISSFPEEVRLAMRYDKEGNIIQ